MTGPAERVPLTDEQLTVWSADPFFGTELQVRCRTLIAELRASRAREQELQHRIEQAITRIDQINPRPDLNPLPSLARLRAILTGARNSTGHR